MMRIPLTKLCLELMVGITMVICFSFAEVEAVCVTSTEGGTVGGHSQDLKILFLNGYDYIEPTDIILNLRNSLVGYYRNVNIDFIEVKDPDQSQIRNILRYYGEAAIPFMETHSADYLLFYYHRKKKPEKIEIWCYRNDGVADCEQFYLKESRLGASVHDLISFYGLSLMFYIDDFLYERRVY